jgi:hypothetical protein
MIKFIKKAGDTMFDSVRVDVEHSIVDEVSLHEMLEEFQRFLLAIGYSFKEGDYLTIANDDDAPSFDDAYEFVNRVEVIDGTGRAYSNTAFGTATFQLQDQDETLKIFLGKERTDYKKMFRE